MRFKLQERRNNNADDHSQKMFAMRNRHRDMRVLRRAGLPGNYVLSVCERRFSRSGAYETDHYVSPREVTTIGLT